ncbi:hypothetical protein [Parapedobacter tibetensis]|uniref:hypothetical protein n=1 Tax=Parapedobacter tibetensis TaxID=2972951 RepID=UPI00214D28E4|nr:hypothetical protein [Parapedobacter tibetensis]
MIGHWTATCFVCVFGLMLLLGGCQSDKGNAHPDIYVDQTVQALMDGVNSMQSSYLRAVESAKSSGLLVQELTSDELETLGTQRYQLAITRDRVALRRESWGFTMSGPYHHPGECRFAITYAGTLEIKTPGNTVTYNLGDSTVAEQEAGIPEAFALQFASLSGRPTPEELHKLTQTGIHGPKAAQVLGHPCTTWEYEDGRTVTLWSEGRQWGFNELPAENMHAGPGAIVLASEKKIKQQTIVLRTQTFTVREPIDLTPFTIE